YTPAVVACAAMLAIVPPLFAGNWSEWIYRGLTFLVISCPCALVISVPLTFFGGIGKASRQGILVKGGNYLEALAMAEAVVFDKTGTITEGKLRVCGLYPNVISGEELLCLGAHGEYYSEHPIAVSIKDAYKGEIYPHAISEYKEIPGKGVECRVNGSKVLAGSSRLVGIKDEDHEGTVVHISRDGVYMGYIDLEDSIKVGAAEALVELKMLGVREAAMLTGDRRAAAEKAAKTIGIDSVYSELMPGDKVKKVEEMLAGISRRGKLVYVGDGINDAPVLSRADVGIAMGAMGSDAAIEAADVVIMDDRLNKLPEAVNIARQTRKIVMQNIVMTLGVKGVILVLGALGFAGMWAAVFADVGIMVVAVLNAMRMLAE
ncbi:MAG: cadmium-translocating P-type ATPase, partial [Clostridia bacterium]|nr:cadmium-translocating P-type ATPase [Clostridia bacterium]